jgi:hypothetical protein
MTCQSAALRGEALKLRVDHSGLNDSQQLFPASYANDWPGEGRILQRPPCGNLTHGYAIAKTSFENEFNHPQVV